MVSDKAWYCVSLVRKVSSLYQGHAQAVARGLSHVSESRLSPRIAASAVSADQSDVASAVSGDEDESDLWQQISNVWSRESGVTRHKSPSVCVARVTHRGTPSSSQPTSPAPMSYSHLLPGLPAVPLSARSVDAHACMTEPEDYMTEPENYMTEPEKYVITTEPEKYVITQPGVYRAPQIGTDLFAM